MTPPVIPELSAPPAEPSDGVDVKEAAAAITKAVLTSETPETPPETPPVETVTPPAAEVPPEGAEPVEGVEPTEVVTPTEVAEIAAEKGVPFADVVEALSVLGIAVETEGVPTELHPQYSTLLENTRAAIAPIVAESQKSAAAAARMKAFEQRLDEKPESVLLTLMVTKPDAFNKVMEIAAQAKDDPEYKERVIRELEVDAREARVEARETRQADEAARTRGNQAAAKTQEAARRHGVSPEVADRYIGGMIAADGPDNFDVFTIDKLVGQLKPAAVAPTTPAHKTPTEVAAAAATPTTPAAPISPPAPVRPGTSSGFDTDAGQPGRGGMIKALVRAAGGRVDQSQQGG